MLPALFWAIITLYLETLNPMGVLVLLILSEFGPAIMHTVLDGCMVVYSKNAQTNITATCQRSRLVGVMIAKTVSGYLLQHSSVRTVFGTQCILLMIVCGGIIMCTSKNTLLENKYTAVVAQSSDEEVPSPPPPVTKKQKVSRSLMFFICFFVAIPTAGNCLFYFVYGPLGISPKELGHIDTFCAFAAFVSTFSARYFTGSNMRLHIRYVVWASACAFVIHQFMNFVLVTRIHVPIIDDFWFILLTSTTYTILDGVLWTFYTSIATESTLTNNEAFGYTVMMTVPKVGSIVNMGIDYSLTKYFEVNHDHYEGLPNLIFICLLLSITTISVSLFVTNEDEPWFFQKLLHGR